MPVKTLRHDATALGLETDAGLAALGCACSFAMSSRVRVRRAIFCLRSTLNLDLSPLTPDICCLLFAAELHVLKLQHAHPRPEREKSALAGIYLAADLSIAKAPSVCSVSVVKHSQYTLHPDILANYRRLPTPNGPSTMPMYVRLNRL